MAKQKGHCHTASFYRHRIVYALYQSNKSLVSDERSHEIGFSHGATGKSVAVRGTPPAARLKHCLARRPYTSPWPIVCTFEVRLCSWTHLPTHPAIHRPASLERRSVRHIRHWNKRSSVTLVAVSRSISKARPVAHDNPYRSAPLRTPSAPSDEPCDYRRRNNAMRHPIALDHE